MTPEQILTMLVLAFAGQDYRERIGTIDDYSEDRSAIGRLEAWNVGLDMAKDNPLFGVGLGRFTKAFTYYSNFQPRVAHNSWIQLSAECGFVAVTAYGMLVLFTVVSLVRIRRRIPLLAPGDQPLTITLGNVLEAALVGYLICGFFLSMEDFEFFYLLVGMVQILDRVTETRVRDAERRALAEAAATREGATPAGTGAGAA